MEDALQQQATPSWQSYLQRKAWELMLPMPVLQPDDSIMMTSQQTYRPKVLKRKRCHGFLKRCATPLSCFAACRLASCWIPSLSGRPILDPGMHAPW